MQQFTVPQFIDVEDKIIGPITSRQFIIMLACFMVIAIFYKVFDFSLFVVSSLALLGFSGVLAFAKINGRPFHYFILNLIQTFKKPNTRVWNKKSMLGMHEVDEAKAVAKTMPTTAKARPAVSRLAELSLIVDTQGMYKGEEEGEAVSIQGLADDKNKPKIELNF